MLGPDPCERSGVMSASALTPSQTTEPPRAARRSRSHSFVIPVYAVALSLAALWLGVDADAGALSDAPLLFVALTACVLALDTFEFDLFGRGHFSPATVPTLAIAALFGPAGVVLSEAVAAAASAARRKPVAATMLDFGALALCGAAAAMAFELLPGAVPGLLVAGAAAGAAYYLANSVLLATAWSLNERTSPVGAWRERLAWAAPHYPAYGVLAALLIMGQQRLGWYVFAVVGLPMAIVWFAQKQYLERSRHSVDELRVSHAELERANARLRDLLRAQTELVAEKERLLERVHRSYVQTVASLARTIEAKDPYTGGHTERVADYALELARELSFSAEDLRSVAVGGVIHDIGKIGIRDQVLLKTGRLDPEEWSEMRRHPEISSYILDELEIPAIAKGMARSHHERFDGGGYPDGLVGEAIPLAARILSVADALDAMTSTRPYRGARPFHEALAEIERNTGTQFCPTVAAALRASYARDAGFWHAHGGGAQALEQRAA